MSASARGRPATRIGSWTPPPTPQRCLSGHGSKTTWWTTRTGPRQWSPRKCCAGSDGCRPEPKDSEPVTLVPRVPWMDHYWLAWAGAVRPALWAAGQAPLSSVRWRTMFERFTDRARRVVVLAQEEARMLNHNYVGTEHILLGLIREREGVGARALESLGISLDAGRLQVEGT